MKIKPERNEQLNQDGWRIDITVDNKRHRAWFATKAEAEAAIAQLTLAKRARKLGLPLPKPRNVITLEQLLAARKREIEAFDSADKIYSTCADFAASLPLGITLNEIKPAHLTAFVQALQQRGLMGNTINTNLARVRSLLRSAARHFPECEFTPPHVPTVKASPPRERLLTPAELWDIYVILSYPEKWPNERWQIARDRKGYATDLFLLLLLTGARHGEIVNLQWPAVSFAFNTFTITATKTDTLRTLPLTPLVREIFERRKQSHPKQPFPKTFIQHRCKLFAKAGARANVPYGQNTENGWTLHTLRHTAISLMLQGGADLLSVQEIVGHTDPNFGTTNVYAHASMQSKLRALMMIEDFWLNLCREKDGVNREKAAKATPNTQSR